MVKFRGVGGIEEALARVGQLLGAEGLTFRIVVIGGSAMNLLGLVDRATTDVDILAFAGIERGVLRLRPPDEPLPEALASARRVVALDLGLDPHWLNTGPAGQWRTGLPPGLEQRVVWRAYGGLIVGLVARPDLVFFKLYAAADDVGPRSVHFQDLLALEPTDEELSAAADWIREQDPGPDFTKVVSEVIRHVREQRERAR